MIIIRPVGTLSASPQKMDKNGNQVLASLSTTPQQITAWTADTATYSNSAVVSDGLVVNGGGKILIEASAGFVASTATTRGIYIYSNGSSVASYVGSGALSLSVAHILTDVSGNALTVYAYANTSTTNNRTMSSGYLKYTLPDIMPMGQWKPATQVLAAGNTWEDVTSVSSVKQGFPSHSASGNGYVVEGNAGSGTMYLNAKLVFTSGSTVYGGMRIVKNGSTVLATHEDPSLATFTITNQSVSVAVGDVITMQAIRNGGTTSQKTVDSGETTTYFTLTPNTV